jgi:hypothetical protein
MNSRQRRKDSRIWKYNLLVTPASYEHYEEMWTWLALNYGKKAGTCGWRDRHIWISGYEYEIIWQFCDKKKYLAFMLKWS